MRGSRKLLKMLEQMGMYDPFKTLLKNMLMRAYNFNKNKITRSFMLT